MSIHKLLKKIAPKKILPRLLLIFLLPLILTQCLLIFFFYDRHWEKIITRFANIASNQIDFIISDYKNNGFSNALNSSKKLNLQLSILDVHEPQKKKMSFFERKIKRKIKNRLNQTVDLEFEENFVNFYINYKSDYFLIKFPRKYLVSETPIILFLWMVSSSLILSLIAFLFLRIQIRAIQRLANSAREYGEGKKIKRFKPEGAMEIRQAGNAFIQMRRRIDLYISQRTSFLAGISHDLGTILTRIKLRLELMKNNKETDSIKKDLQTMEMFLKEYLDYSEKINIKRFSKINIYQLVNEVVNSSKYLRKKTIIICKKKLIFNTDKNCLYRIIFNLCENASRYGDKIIIRVLKKKNQLLIEIEDDGPGIPNEFKKQIFKPFFKVDNSRNLNESGSGLGLSIAKELVKKLKGEISLNDSSKSNGCVFKINL